MRGLAGKVAIVTGATRGIGLAIAQRLVEEGVQVCITGRNSDGIVEAVQTLGGPTRAIGMTGHAADADHQADAIKATADAFGPVDLLINNTGINPVYGPLMELDLAAAQRTVEVNCLAALSWAQHAYTNSMRRRGGSVVNVSSIAALSAASGVGFYGSTKAMLMHLTRQMAYELGPAIRVNAVAPGVVKTKFAAALYEDREHEMLPRYPMRRLGQPNDVSGPVAFLLSEEAQWITGHTIVIDGGVSLAGGDA